MKISIRRSEKRDLELNGIRKCSEECYFFKNGGTGCIYFQKKEVSFGQSCQHDLIHLKNYSDAFASGDLDFVKKDASGITAMLIMQIRRMLEQVNIEGVTVDEPLLDGKGNPVWIPDPKWKPSDGGQQRMIVAMRKIDHPLIPRCIQLARSLGINLADFKLTPKSADEKRQVSGHVISENPKKLEEIMVERRKIEQRFIDAVEAGTKMTLEDPVFKALNDSGEIVN